MESDFLLKEAVSNLHHLWHFQGPPKQGGAGWRGGTPDLRNTALSSSNVLSQDLPGGPVLKTPRFHCRGRGFDPLVRELRFHGPRSPDKRLKKKKSALSSGKRNISLESGESELSQCLSLTYIIQGWCISTKERAWISG